MSDTYNYPAELERDEDGRYVVVFPDFGWGATDGATREEALGEARDLLRELIATTMREGKALPERSQTDEKRPLVVPPVAIALKAAFYEAFREAGMSQPASEYLFEFDDGTVAEPLTHGEHILRANVVCRWWRSDPRAPFTRGAIEAVLHPSYEILRIDLWQKRFERPRLLRRIRWRLQDQESIQAMFAISVETG